MKRPQIDDVLDVDAGMFVSAAAVMGTDYARPVRLRMQVRTRMRRDVPMYKCATCGVAVHICCSRENSRLFFNAMGDRRMTGHDAQKYERPGWSPFSLNRQSAPMLVGFSAVYFGALSSLATECR